MLTKFFGVPFAQSGDRTAVPVVTQPDGSVNFTDGYGVDYALDPAIDPDAILIERRKFNQLMYDITSSLSSLQQDFPQWASAADNDGVAVAYNKDAVVRYTVDGKLWQSLVAANNTVPGADPTKWVVFLTQYALTSALNAEIARAMNAEALLAPLASPAFTGSPTAPTQAPGTVSTLLATCAFVASAVAAETNRATTQENLRAPINNPTFTGSVTVPPVAVGTNNNLAATCAMVTAAVAAETSRAISAEAALAPRFSPAFAGVPTTPTPPGNSNDDTIPNTAWVRSVLPNISPTGNLVGHYAQVNVPIGGSFAIAAFSWDAPFNSACVAAVGVCQTNRGFTPSSAGNNMTVIVYGPGGPNTPPDRFGGYVRIDTEQGGVVSGNVGVSVMGFGV